MLFNTCLVTLNHQSRQNIKSMLGLASVPTFFSSFRQRFSRRLDSEHEQAFVRLVIGVLLVSYFSYFTIYGSSTNQKWHVISLAVMAGFITVSALLIILIAIYPGVSPVRRLIGASVDVGATTYFSFTAAEFAAPLYCLYLWIVIGHGFRFGNRYLFFALTLSILGFGAAVLTLPYWAENQTLGIGLWIGMLLVSLYISTLVGRLTTALEYAEAANQAKRRFISSISHELRTPLNAIIGMANLLQGTKLDKEQEDMVRSMDNASHLMLSLIEDVLDFSKIEAGKLVIESTPFDLYHLVFSTIDIFKYQATVRGLDLQAYISPDVPHALHGDPHHLRQVLINLLSNAVKFTEKGRITVRIGTLADAEQSFRLRFEVEDTGIGIAKDAQAKIFDSFTQADESTTRRYGGTGLGTTICKQLVELMGGRLGLQSEAGVGSTFWFELDLRKCRPSTPDFSQLSDLRILLVGFDKSQAAIVGNILEEYGVAYEELPNRGLAIAQMQKAVTAQNPYSLILATKPALIKHYEKSLSVASIAFIREAVNDFSAVNGKRLPVVLCLDERSENGIPRLVEESGLSAILNFPIAKPLLVNVLHAIKISNSQSLLTVMPATSSSNSPVTPGGHLESGRERYSILVAEDNLTNQKVIQKVLERAGYLCTLVQNGEEALDQLSQQDFDAVVLDMNMPVMSGLEAVKAYRFMTPDEMRMPIVMFSADVTREAKEECYGAGVDEFLPKPIQVSSFLRTLDSLVQKNRSVRRPKMYRPTPDNVAVLAQPSGGEIVLNYATLAELESIGQDRLFVDGLLDGFIKDNDSLMERIEEALLLLRFEEFKEALHAIKGSAASIGAVSLRATCHQLEMLTHGELMQDIPGVLHSLKDASTKLGRAIDQYRKQRNNVVPLRN